VVQVATPLAMVCAVHPLTDAYVEPFDDASKFTVPVAPEGFIVAVIITEVPKTCGDEGDVVMASELPVVPANAGLEEITDKPTTSSNESIPVPNRETIFERKRNPSPCCPDRCFTGDSSLLAERVARVFFSLRIWCISFRN
jgi:hypothetical protein